MADAQPDTQASGMPDLASLYGGGGLDPALTSGLADLERRKIHTDEAISAKTNRTLDEDSARMKQAFAAEGASAHDIQPWNEKAESAKHNYDPIEAFGSVGSVFAILASAFTHQPMENALNGAAAAMNAIKAGKNEEYKRAYDAWKSNTELAEKRHQMMHEEYVDAGELLKTNLAAGRAKMTAAAARFGDQKTLFLLEHGMDKELIDLQNARQTSALKMGEAKLKMQTEFAKIGLLYDMKDKDGTQLYDPQHPGSPKSQEAYQKWMHLTSPYSAHTASADQTFVQQYYTEHPDATAEQFMKAFGEWKTAQKTGGKLTPDQQFLSQYKTEHPNATSEELASAFGKWKKQQKDAHVLSPDQQFLQEYHTEHPNADTKEIIKAFGEWKQAQKAGGPGGTLNMGNEKAAAVEEMLKTHPEMSHTEAIQKVIQSAQPLASTRVDDIKQSVDRIDTAEHIMDKIEALLKKHNAITGFGGHVTRTGETLAEILGANSSDFKEFHRLVSTLQTLGPRVLLDSKGRPIGAETGKIDEVFAGNNFGDLNQNTLRAYKELRDIFEFQKKKYRARLPGSDSSEAPDTSGDSGEKWWESPAAGRVK